MAGALMGGMPKEMNTQPMEPAPQDGAAAPSASGPASGGVDPQMMELFTRTVDYTREALAQGADEILAAMKVDAVAAAVKFGVRALRAVAAAAEEAGSPLPPEVVLAAGVQTIKDLGAAAEANGVLSEDQDDVFVKEAVQQAIAEFASLDRDEGRIEDEDMAALEQMAPAAAEAQA